MFPSAGAELRIAVAGPAGEIGTIGEARDFVWEDSNPE
jgi:hypothetical protein